MKKLPDGLAAVVPAAGIGARMQADLPKQYLALAGRTVLEHTLLALLKHPAIKQVWVVVAADDPYFEALALARDSRIRRVNGGAERVDSVLAGVDAAVNAGAEWVLVHDAARPCVSLSDLDRLLGSAQTHHSSAILATPVRDTMKRDNGRGQISTTVSRDGLWHALTPQIAPAARLQQAIRQAQNDGVAITDEASALEHVGDMPLLVEGSAFNLKITRPDDLVLAEWILTAGVCQ